MAQVMLLEAVAAGTLRGGAQNAPGTGLFAQSLGNALGNLGDGELMQALLKLPAGFQPTAEEAAVALENLKAMGAPGALVAALKALSEQAGAQENAEDKRGNAAFGELVAMLMPLAGRINTVPVGTDASAGTLAQGAAAPAEPQSSGAAQAGAAAEAANALTQAAAAAGGLDSPVEPTADGAAQARPTEPVAPAVPVAQASAAPVEANPPDTTPAALEGRSAATAQAAVAPQTGAPATDEAVETADAAKAPAPAEAEVAATDGTASQTADSRAAAAAAVPAIPVVEEVKAAQAGETSLEDVKSVEGRVPERLDTAVKDAAAQDKASRADQERIIARIAQAVTQAQHGERSTVRLRLYPPELGTVRVEVSSVRGSVTVRIETSTPEAHSALSANLQGLRVQLADSGVDARGVEVQYRNPALAFGHARDEAGRGNGYWQARRETSRRSDDREDEPVPAASGAAEAPAGDLDILL